MTKLIVKTIYSLLNERDLSPSTEIKFIAGKWSIDPKHIEIGAINSSKYSGDPGQIIITISDEFIEIRVQERMKQLFNKLVDSMFEQNKTEKQ